MLSGQFIKTVKITTIWINKSYSTKKVPFGTFFV